jgi:hypothetical protein
MALDFKELMNLSVVKPDNTKLTQPKGYDKTVSKGDFKVLKNGTLVYSDAFVNELDAKVLGGPHLKYLDVADGRLMKFGDNNGRPAMFVGIVPFKAPAASIQLQEQAGKVAFIKSTFLQLVTELYGINWEETKEVEFKIVREAKVEGYNGKHYIPRVVVKGKKKGDLSYVTREDIDLYPCLPIRLLEEQAKTPEAPQIEVPFELGE